MAVLHIVDSCIRQRCTQKDLSFYKTVQISGVWAFDKSVVWVKRIIVFSLISTPTGLLLPVRYLIRQIARAVFLIIIRVMLSERQSEDLTPASERIKCFIKFRLRQLSHGSSFSAFLSIHPS
jgi:hypothetical protein